MAFTQPEQEQLYLEYHDKILGYVRGKIYNQWEAEDIVSGIFVKIYKNIDKFDRERASVSTWVYTITRNTVVDYFRAQKQVYSLDAMVVDVGKSDENILREENLDLLADVLRRLEPRERTIIINHYYKERTLKDIAEMLGMSYANIKLVHQKALGKMQVYMKKIM